MKNVVGPSFRGHIFFFFTHFLAFRADTSLGEKLVARRLLKSAKLVRLFWFMAARVGVFQRRIFRASHVILSKERPDDISLYYSPRVPLLLNKRIIMKESIFLLTPPQTIEAFCFVQNLRFPSPVENNSHSNFSTREPSRQCAAWINARGAKHLIDIWKRKIRHDTPPPPPYLSRDPISRMTKWISTRVSTHDDEGDVRSRMERERGKERRSD